MNTKAKSKGPNTRYLVTAGINGKIDQVVVTRAELACLDPNDVDVQINEAKQEIYIKHKNRKRSIRYLLGKIQGFGVYEWKLLIDIVWSSGDIVQLVSAGHINQRVRRLRRLFKDSKGNEWFFDTRTAPYGIALNTARSWRYIDTLAESD